MPDIVLASASPRRQALLKELGLNFTCKPQNIDEAQIAGEGPESHVRRLALEKARSAMAAISETGHGLVLGSDTIVVCEERILGKPVNKEDACDMLSLLAGRQHQVLTAVALINHEREEVALSRTLVTFREMDAEEIESYWNTGEPADKAGAYAIQGLGGMFISEIKGSYSGVVGLPVYETVGLLTQFGMDAKQILNTCNG